MHTEDSLQESDAVLESAILPHLDDLYRAALSLLGSARQAEESVQRAVGRAWRTLDAADPAIGVRAWLFRTVLDEVRRQRRTVFRWRLNPFRPDTEPTSNASPNQDGSGPGGVLAALQALPVHLAETVLLVDVFDFSVTHARETLGLSPQALDARLREGRRLLGEYLDVQPATGAGQGRKPGQTNNYRHAGAGQ